MGWHAALQHRDVEYHQEDLALQHWAHTVQSRVSMSVHVNATLRHLARVTLNMTVLHRHGSTGRKE